MENAIQEAMSELDKMTTVDQPKEQKQQKPHAQSQDSKHEKKENAQPPVAQQQSAHAQSKSHVHGKMAAAQTIIKGEIAGRLRSSQR